MTKIICNSFVKRQTPDSPFSYYAGSWEGLEAMAEVAFSEGKTSPGYRDGVMRVSVNPDKFFTGVVEVKEGTQLIATFKARREGEEPVIEVFAKGEKTPAEAVDLVIYRQEVLEGDASSTPADWEIVSINARAYAGKPEPLHPLTMMRNQLGLPGGTKAMYSSEEWAEASWYWSKRAMRAE